MRMPASMPHYFGLFADGKSRLMDEITTLLSRAAASVLQFESSVVARRVKGDLSPVTAADDAAQSVILEGLSKLLPGIPVISEEMDRLQTRLIVDSVFVLVDPLDGTREYLAGRNEFTVNIGFISNGAPTFGCIAAPALGIVWRGLVGLGAERLQLPAGAGIGQCNSKTALGTRPLPKEKPVLAVSRSHFDARTEKFIARLPQAERIFCGSSLKFCLIAEGRVDVYPRLAPTHEWDIAAGHAIVAAAGGAVVTQAGMPMTYGRVAEDFRVDGFVAFGDVGAAQTLLREPVD
jgi:3'(2'), 5'-bisphosphate nucleotidase